MTFSRFIIPVKSDVCSCFVIVIELFLFIIYFITERDFSIDANRVKMLKYKEDSLKRRLKIFKYRSRTNEVIKKKLLKNNKKRYIYILKIIFVLDRQTRRRRRRSRGCPF